MLFPVRLFKVISCAAIALFALCGDSAEATTIDPKIWQQMIWEADFVGIVECEVAGGGVALYRVVESWKGPPPGTRFALRVAVNYWEPQFPIALCGDRYFVTAYKSPRSSIASFSSGGPVPLWWRKAPADYALPLFQGRLRLPADTDGKELSLHSIGSEHESFEVFEKAARHLLAAQPNHQEQQVLKALAEKYVFGPYARDSDQPIDENQMTRLRTEINEAKSPRDVVDSLMPLAKEDPKKWSPKVRHIFEQGAGHLALERIKQIDPANIPWDSKEHERLMRNINRRIQPNEQAPQPDSAAEYPDVSKEQLQQMRKTLAANPKPGELYRLLQPASLHDPAAMVNYLVNWIEPQGNWRYRHMGYVLGSYFGYYFRNDRTAHLRTLLNAKDPYTRTAAAVYLAFEDEASGLEQLSHMSELQGDPGVWAALNLARRGQKAAIPRALKVFQTPGEGGMRGVPHRNLQKRLMVLLSNSARKSELPQPTPPEDSPGREPKHTRRSPEDRSKTIYEYFAEWWRKNEANLTLDDPWLAELKKQKVD